jgi:GNAT superfamily N-acetyltransferase
MSVQIRRAAAADVQTLAEMRYAFRTALAPGQEDEAAFIARVSAWMADRLTSSRDWYAWVATTDDAIVGTIWLERVEKMPNPVREAECLGYITNMFVSPACRSAGVGSMLLRAAAEFADHNGFHTLILWPSPRSREFYTRHGFEARDNLFARVSKAAVHP